MKNKSLFFTFMIFVNLLPVPVNASTKECKCHSKNNKMRRMHEITGFKNCILMLQGWLNIKEYLKRKI